MKGTGATNGNRQNEADIALAIDRISHFLAGDIIARCEAAARSLGVPTDAITSGVAELLHGSPDGEILRNALHLSSVRGTSAETSQVLQPKVEMAVLSRSTPAPAVRKSPHKAVGKRTDAQVQAQAKAVQSPDWTDAEERVICDHFPAHQGSLGRFGIRMLAQLPGRTEGGIAQHTKRMMERGQLKQTAQTAV